MIDAMNNIISKIIYNNYNKKIGRLFNEEKRANVNPDVNTVYERMKEYPDQHWSHFWCNIFESATKSAIAKVITPVNKVSPKHTGKTQTISSYFVHTLLK